MLLTKKSLRIVSLLISMLFIILACTSCGIKTEDIEGEWHCFQSDGYTNIRFGAAGVCFYKKSNTDDEIIEYSIGSYKIRGNTIYLYEDGKKFLTCKYEDGYLVDSYSKTYFRF